MKVFVGYGNNDRDAWIEKQIIPMLEAIGFSVVHGKDMHGLVLHDEVRNRLDQSDAAVGFFTIREGQGDAAFNSHMWVRDEMVHAHAKEKPIIAVKENGVNVPDGLLGNRQYIGLDQSDRLACAVEVVRTLGQRNMRRVRLEPQADKLRQDLFQWRKQPGFGVRCRTQDANGIESNYRPGRLEVIDQGFYLNVADVPRRAYVEVEGVLNGDTKFSSGWVSADAIAVKIA